MLLGPPRPRQPAPSQSSRRRPGSRRPNPPCSHCRAGGEGLGILSGRLANQAGLMPIGQRPTGPMEAGLLCVAGVVPQPNDFPYAGYQALIVVDQCATGGRPGFPMGVGTPVLIAVDAHGVRCLRDLPRLYAGILADGLQKQLQRLLERVAAMLLPERAGTPATHLTMCGSCLGGEPIPCRAGTPHNLPSTPFGFFPMMLISQFLDYYQSS